MRLGRSDPKVEALGRCRLFAELDKDELRRLAQLCEDVDIPAGETVAQEGTFSPEFVVVVDGELDVRRDGQAIGSLGPGDFFGEISLVDGGPKTATVVATTDVRAFVLSRPAFWEVLDESPRAMKTVMKAVASRLRELAADPRH